MARLRDFTPRGYNARNILMLIVPMLIFLIVMALFFFDGHVRQVNAKLSRSFAQELAMALDARQADPEGWDELARAFGEAGLMRLAHQPGAALSTPPGRSCCAELRGELAVLLDAPSALAYDPASDRVTVRVAAPDGVIEAQIERKRVVVITAHIFIVWSALFSALLLGASYAFLRNQVRSIVQLSRAADAFGRGEDAPGFKPSGAQEVRQAARSLIRMRNRIRRYADQRTAMLAGVSHDLRTPLTRLKLELALLPPGLDLAAARADIAEMERMLDAYLAFARGEDGEESEDADLGAIAREAAAHAATRTQLELSAEPIAMRLRPLALKRAIANLANNAADHGRRVRIRVARDHGFAAVTVEDDGPGIAPDQYEDAFRPFSRLDAARNQNVSGVGLGLTIARDTARAHGGDVVLGRSDLGGLRAVLRLPIELGAQGD
jgi:two-component system osmolarity sensor histidine kinase EnvZ